jgi:hypothetical protein
MKREIKRRHICGCRCNERQTAKTEGSMLLSYTGLRGEPGHLKIETRIRGERLESVMGVCVKLFSVYYNGCSEI